MSLRFICVYPIYINSKKTLAEGRRIPTEKAVENPDLMSDAFSQSWAVLGQKKLSFWRHGVLKGQRLPSLTAAAYSTCRNSATSLMAPCCG
ncbi:Signal recognition particle 19 kDa protein [Collichthys lucidus]|uniref:Signal recognition particle 19 kDa protein n=1 Tax=Collichthys lucidus TaxID=240159 RepID=A0A4U5U738_COLLU|nr:Signal recognition particle 19 kDa protein [Collichthys lucidus]